MKSLFRGYYKLTDNEIQNIWSQGFISLDTNVLCNIYRYSEDTRKELIRVIKKYSSQLWLTNHSGFEFHKNRVAVISEQISIYEETIKKFQALENDIIKNPKTPHLSESILQKFEKTIKETIKDLERKKEFYNKLVFNDSILSVITTIFNKKVGEAFTPEEIIKIEKEGEERYKNKIPPGFKDNDKTQNKYGDLIIWKELIRKAKVDNKPFILIIDDLKEDWWLKAQGQKISPRQELSQELYKESKQTFHLYTPDRFLEFASKTEKVKQEAIDEVREIRLVDYLPFNNGNFLQNPYNPSSVGDLINRSPLFSNLNKYNSLADLSQSIKESYAINDLFKNNDFIKNIDAFKSIGDFSKTWGTINPLSEIIKNNEIHSNLSNIKSLGDIQNTYRSISDLTSSNPLIDPNLKEEKE